MNISRTWATPLTAGAFLLSAVTGILMFFHLDSGLNMPAHEWFSWALLTGVSLHLTANFTAFKNHLATNRARWIIGIFALLLALSFAPIKEADKPSSAGALKAITAAPLTTVALVAGISPDEVSQRITAQGYTVSSTAQSIADFSGADQHKKRELLQAIFNQ